MTTCFTRAAHSYFITWPTLLWHINSTLASKKW